MRGLIGFFDILGYQSFLENNNSATDSALKVLTLINEIPSKTKAGLETLWATLTEDVFKEQKDLHKNFNHLIFSDTIVLTLKYPDKPSESWKNAAFLYMLIAGNRLTAKMFEEGLPVRGVLHEGDFIYQNACFAGRGIVDAYQLCNRLDFGGFVLSEALGKWTDETRATEKIFPERSYPNMVVPMLTPLKDSELRLYHPNYLFVLSTASIKEVITDPIQFVMKGFWAHGKECPKSADSKVRNTCKILRRLRIALEHEKEMDAKDAKNKSKSP